MFKLLIGAALGAAAAWFLDPDNGPRRRSTARDKATSYGRKGTQQAVDQATQVSDVVKGKASAAAPGIEREPVEERLNDPALRAKVESEIFRASDAPKDKVSVNVEAGVVYLRGELDDPAAIEQLRRDAARVDGVRSVQSLLHRPGEPAPTKDESRHTPTTPA